jgi:hypothetical protein
VDWLSSSCIVGDGRALRDHAQQASHDGHRQLLKHLQGWYAHMSPRCMHETEMIKTKLFFRSYVQFIVVNNAKARMDSVACNHIP